MGRRYRWLPRAPNCLGPALQEEEQDLVAFGTRESRGPTPQSPFNSSGAPLDGQRALHSSFDHPLVTCPGEVQNGQIVQSTTAVPLRRSLRLQRKQNPSLYRTDSRFLNSPVEEVGFRPLKVIGRPIDKWSVYTTQGQRWSVLEVGENLGQERIIESHTVGPEVQGIQTTVEALSPVERIDVAPGVSAGLAPEHHRWRGYGDKFALRV